jgi:phosphoribosyl-dephospho-CoA transferase
MRIGTDRHQGFCSSAAEILANFEENGLTHNDTQTPLMEKPAAPAWYTSITYLMIKFARECSREARRTMRIGTFRHHGFCIPFRDIPVRGLQCCVCNEQHAHLCTRGTRWSLEYLYFFEVQRLDGTNLSSRGLPRVHLRRLKSTLGR